jgi:hypothetical protein
MMEKLSESEVGSDKKFKIQDLDITCYVNAPNIVNCCNSHGNKAYRLFPTLPSALKVIKPL